MIYKRLFAASKELNLNSVQVEHLRRTNQIKTKKYKGDYYYDIDSYNIHSDIDSNLIIGTSQYQIEYLRSYMNSYELKIDYEILSDNSNDDGFDKMLLLISQKKIGNIYAVDHQTFVRSSNFADYHRLDALLRIIGIRVFFVENFRLNDATKKDVKINMTDEIAIEFFETNRLALGRKTPKLVEKYKDFFDYVYNRFDDLTGNEKLVEVIYRIRNKIEKVPTCPVCGKRLSFHNSQKTYPIACHSCKATKEGKKIIAQIKYDMHDWTPIHTDEEALQIYKEHKQFYHKTEAFIKQESPEFWDYLRNRFKDASEDDIIQELMYRLVNKIEEKPKCIICGKPLRYNSFAHCYNTKYCGDCNRKTEVIIQSQKIARENMKKRGTVNKSKEEEITHEYFKQMLYNIEPQHKDVLYPYYCDFYFKDYDLYVEINGHWSHGPHPFNPDNEKDIEYLEYLKSKDTAQYQSAIDVWTLRDPKKRKTAKDNKLNYLEIFSVDADEIVDDIKEFIEEIKTSEEHLQKVTVHNKNKEMSRNPRCLREVYEFCNKMNEEYQMIENN